MNMDKKEIKTKYWILIIIFCTVISIYLLSAASSNVSIGMWSGMILYGILNNYIGSTDIIDDFKNTQNDDYDKLFGFEIDSVLIPQLSLIIFSLFIVIFSEFIQYGVNDVLSTITDVQMIGLVILLSRITVSLWSQKEDRSNNRNKTTYSIGSGAWYKTVYSIGLLLIIIPYLQLHWMIPDKIYWVAILTVIPSFVILGIEHKNIEPESAGDYWDKIKNYSKSIYNFVK